MKKLTITITITDPETLEDYEETSEDLIVADFLDCPEAWVSDAEVEVAKE